MAQLIQIAPGVVFAAEVFSPTWGREFYSQTTAPGARPRVTVQPDEAVDSNNTDREASSLIERLAAAVQGS